MGNGERHPSFFKYSSKPKLVFSGVGSRNSTTVCPGFTSWCLLSGVIKTRSGGEWQLKSLSIHCPFTAAVHGARPAGQARLPNAQRLGTRRAPPSWQDLGGSRAHTDSVAPVPDSPSSSQAPERVQSNLVALEKANPRSQPEGAHASRVLKGCWPGQASPCHPEASPSPVRARGQGWLGH